MVELGVVGEKNSGKTTLIEALVRTLAERGYSVATIKHTSHRHTFDQPGKDSHRHRQAGAGMTLAVSGSELALFAGADDGRRRKLLEIMASAFDLCLVEGDRSGSRPKLMVTRNLRPDESHIPDNVVACYGTVSPDDQTPTFAPDDVDGLTSFIVARYLAKSREASDA